MTEKAISRKILNPPNAIITYTMIKRIALFLALNFLVVVMISVILNVLGVRPFLEKEGLNLGSLLVFCLIWGMVGALISLMLSRVMAKWMMGVRIIDPNTHDSTERHLYETVQRLAHKAHLPMPEVGIYASREINAFATGPSKKRSLVAVSSGLIERMSDEEIQAIIGHELTHIANGDMVTMTLLQGVVNAFVMFLARILAYVFSGLGKNREQNSSHSGTMNYILFVYLFEVVFMILGSLLIAAFSRWREFRADAGGAKLVSRGAMVRALEALQAAQNVHDPRKEQPAIAALKIAHPSKKGLFALFATHPPLELRIQRLLGARPSY
ncbi:MAG: hypothetical protein RL235_274 [Chlamydiota bacterium]|jgi:heat shock protein HtpX